MIVDLLGPRWPGNGVVGTDDPPVLDERDRNDRHQEASAVHGGVPDVVGMSQRVAGGVEGGPAAPGHERLHGGGERRVAHRVGQVDHRGAHPRTEPPRALSVVRDEPHDREPDDTAGLRPFLGSSARNLGCSDVMALRSAGGGVA